LDRDKTEVRHRMHAFAQTISGFGVAAGTEACLRQRRDTGFVFGALAPDFPIACFGAWRHEVRVRAPTGKGKAHQRGLGSAPDASSARRRAVAGAASGGGDSGCTQSIARTSKFGRKSTVAPSTR